jgi:hypothetical protein
MIGDIEIDMPTHERLLAAQEVGELAYLMPRMLAAVVAGMTGTMGREATAAILREWAEQTERSS